MADEEESKAEELETAYRDRWERTGWATMAREARQGEKHVARDEEASGVDRCMLERDG